MMKTDQIIIFGGSTFKNKAKLHVARAVGFRRAGGMAQ
jgi:hypothetical protein